MVSTQRDAGSDPAITPLVTQGRELLDPCGELDVLQVLTSKANAVRIRPATAQSLSQLDAILSLLAERNLITFLFPPNQAWLAQQEMRTLLNRHSSHLTLDAFFPSYDDRERFVSGALEAVAALRGYGYEVPLFVMSNVYGRDVPALLEYGPQIVATDPLQNIVMG